LSFTVLSLVCLVALLGPLLALDERRQVPVVVGELAAGLVLGQSGVGYLDATDPTFAFLAAIGFALVMFVAGTHVPVGRLDGADLRSASLSVVLVGVAAVVLGFALAAVVGTGHGALYAVLVASSSAALVLPVVDSLGLQGPAVTRLVAQVAIADTVCIVAVPLVVDPADVGRATLGTVLVLGVGCLVWFVFRHLDRIGVRRRVHDLSERRRFALELRINLVVLFALAALATHVHVSVMLAGFVFGLAVAAIGEPRRLARQLFALADGFFAPLFFVWFGASLDVRALGEYPDMALLGVALGVAAVLAHLVARVAGQPLAGGLLSSAQLGVPVAATTVGAQLGVLRPGEGPALLVGALVTVAAAALGGSSLVRDDSLTRDESTGPTSGPTGVGGPG